MAFVKLRVSVLYYSLMGKFLYKTKVFLTVFFIFSFFIFLSFFTKTDVFARRGCCSHHGGIAYCGNGGYYICNDGTRSPTCTCFDYDDDSEYIFTQPKIYTIPSDTLLHSTFYKGTRERTCGVFLKWERPKGHFSVGLSKTQFADPGPLADTDIPEYFIDDVRPGVWHFNIKEWYDNRWTRVASWEIEVQNCGDITYAQYKRNLEIEERKKAMAEEENKLRELEKNKKQSTANFNIADIFIIITASLGTIITIGNYYFHKR